MKMKNGVVTDIETTEITPDSGVKIEDTKMLSGTGELPAGYDDTNKTSPYSTGPQPKSRSWHV